MQHGEMQFGEMQLSRISPNVEFRPVEFLQILGGL